MRLISLRTPVIALIATAALGVVPSGAQGYALIGIADQKASMFTDQRFLDLGLKYARVSLPWDMLRYDFAARDGDAWLSQARARGVTPLVTFQKSRVRPKFRPSTTEFLREFKKFKAKYPWVREYATWNEPNLEDKGGAKRIANYYLALRANCKGCKVLGGDLVDQDNMIPWTRKFLTYTKGRNPRLWGLHNYVTVNRKSTRAAEDLRRLVKGSKVWLTETGGLIARRSNSKLKIPQGVNHAARVTDFILKTWGDSSKFPRVYLYHWNSSTTKDTWDSAFIGPDGQARPSLDVLRKYLGKDGGA